jgi:hypothetical protein
VVKRRIRMISTIEMLQRIASVGLITIEGNDLGVCVYAAIGEYEFTHTHQSVEASIRVVYEQALSRASQERDEWSKRFGQLKWGDKEDKMYKKMYDDAMRVMGSEGGRNEN